MKPRWITTTALIPKCEVEWLRASKHENLYLQHALYLIGRAVTGNVILNDWYSLAQKEEEYEWFKSKFVATMENIKAAYKRTEELAISAGHKQALEEANLGRSNAVKALEEANLAYAKLEESARKDLQARDASLVDVNRRLLEAEARAAKAEEERGQAVAMLDDAISMNANLIADRAWMREFGVVHVTNAILDAPETTYAVADVVAHARDAGYKAGYTECLTHVNAISKKKFTDE
ncbi:hypothetical protein Hanom_Chr11g01051171 [Helianthus anomalus]